MDCIIISSLARRQVTFQHANEVEERNNQPQKVFRVRMVVQLPRSEWDQTLLAKGGSIYQRFTITEIPIDIMVHVRFTVTMWKRYIVRGATLGVEPIWTSRRGHHVSSNPVIIAKVSPGEDWPMNLLRLLLRIAGSVVGMLSRWAVKNYWDIG